MELVSKDICVGCGACYDACKFSALTMNVEKDGFLYPHINQKKCTNCGECIKSCPVNPINEFKVADKNFTTKVYVAWNNDIHKRLGGASGGIFSAIAESIIVDGGVVVGAAYNNEFKVGHVIIDDEKKIGSLSGSKYVQSETIGIFSEIVKILESGKKVLFSGTPCQVLALRTFLKTPYDNLTTCEIFCHGVSSPGIFKDYIDYLNRKSKKQVSSFNFRSKIKGWQNPHIVIGYSNGSDVIYKHRDNIYMSMFGKHLSVRKSCYKCVARRVDNNKNIFVNKSNRNNIELLRTADLSIGDFWGVQNYYDIDISKGVSALLINSVKGEELIKRNETKLQIKESNIRLVVEKNKPLIENYPIPKGRETFWSQYEKLRFPLFINYYKGIFIKDLIIQKVKYELLRVSRGIKK